MSSSSGGGLGRTPSSFARCAGSSFVTTRSSDADDAISCPRCALSCADGWRELRRGGGGSDTNPSAARTGVSGAGERGGEVVGIGARARNAGSFRCVVMGSPIAVGGITGGVSMLGGGRRILGGSGESGDSEGMSGSAVCGGEVGGEESMRSLRLMDERLVVDAEGSGVGDGGVGGSGPLGGGNGGLTRVGEAGMGYRAVLAWPLLLPMLELLRCPDDETDRRPGSSMEAREARPEEGCEKFTFCPRNANDSRKVDFDGGADEAGRAEGLDGVECSSPGVGGSAPSGTGRGGGGIDARCAERGRGPCEKSEIPPSPVARDCDVSTVLQLCTDPPDSRFGLSGRDGVSGLRELEPTEDERLGEPSAAYGWRAIRVLRDCGEDGGVAGGGPYGGLRRYGWLALFDHRRFRASSGEDDAVCSFDAKDDIEDHDARPRLSFGRPETGDAGIGGLELSRPVPVLVFFRFTPRLSAVLPFACAYAIGAPSVELETAMELTVPARLRGGGWRDCEPMSELTRPGTMKLPSRSRGAPTYSPPRVCPGRAVSGSGSSFSTRCRSLSGRIFRSSRWSAGVATRGVGGTDSEGDIGRSLEKLPLRSMLSRLEPARAKDSLSMFMFMLWFAYCSSS